MRTDPGKGGFSAHQPADARPAVERSDGERLVRVEDFVSTTVAPGKTRKG